MQSQNRTEVFKWDEKEPLKKYCHGLNNIVCIVLNVLHRQFLGCDRLEKRMWMNRNTEWQVEKIWSLSLKPLYLILNKNGNSFGRTKTAQEGDSKTENA